MRLTPRLVAAAWLWTAAACGPRADILTISGSALGAEGIVLRRQVERFAATHPGVPVDIQATPGSPAQRLQLYVQWLNGWAPDPDILQLYVIWTPEFAAAGWIAPLDRFSPSTQDFFATTIAANR